MVNRIERRSPSRQGRGLRCAGLVGVRWRERGRPLFGFTPRWVGVRAFTLNVKETNFFER